MVPSRGEDIRKVMLLDVSKAHLYALINADVDAFVDLPLECRKDGVCGKLNCWLYGMRPISKGWEIEYTKRLGCIGFLLEKASPCCFHRESDDLSIVAHCDDFVSEGPSSVFDEIVRSLQKHWSIKVMAVLGPKTTGRSPSSTASAGGTRMASSTRRTRGAWRNIDGAWA